MGVETDVGTFPDAVGDLYQNTGDHGRKVQNKIGDRENKGLRTGQNAHQRFVDDDGPKCILIRFAADL